MSSATDQRRSGSTRVAGEPVAPPVREPGVPAGAASARVRRLRPRTRRTASSERAPPLGTVVLRDVVVLMTILLGRAAGARTAGAGGRWGLRVRWCPAGGRDRCSPRLGRYGRGQ